MNSRISRAFRQIRFAKGNIKEAFGEVLATIRREFELD
jgi:uncharacterized protein YjbJ (UPF0337 family)